jgi:hypothetical protein
MVTTLARRSTSISRAWFGLALVILTGFQFRATATVMTNAVNSGMGGTSPSAFDANISALDLVNTGQLTLSGTTATAPTFPPYTLNGLHDGAAATDANLAFWLTNTTSVTVTFTLNTSASPLGYDISSVRNIQGFPSHAGIYANQMFDILYSTVSDPSTFQPLATISYQPFAANDNNSGSTMVTLTNTTGVLATQVAALQLNIPITSSQSAVYREFDVFGTPIPEPSACALLGLGGLLLLKRRVA